MPNEWRTIKALVHKTRLHGRRGKRMAESFNELDVPHGWEEITHTHKCTKGTSNCAMIHAQYEYKSGKDRYIPRAGHARIYLNTVHEAQAQYTLCNGNTTVRVKTRTSRYTARAGHAKPLYKGYTHSTHCAIVHAQLRVQKRVKRTLPVLAMSDHSTTGTSTVHTVQWYNHSTSKNTGQ